MAKTKSKKRSAKSASSLHELDSVYLLKLVLYLIIGAQWIRFENSAGTTQVPIPVGLIIGVLFAMHDHFKIDRKIEYAILLIAMFVGFWTQVGVYIRI
jgi:energy-converting hydrogenase Eha subunit F